MKVNDILVTIFCQVSGLDLDHILGAINQPVLWRRERVPPWRGSHPGTPGQRPSSSSWLCDHQCHQNHDTNASKKGKKSPAMNIHDHQCHQKTGKKSPASQRRRERSATSPSSQCRPRSETCRQHCRLNFGWLCQIMRIWDEPALFRNL